MYLIVFWFFFFSLFNSQLVHAQEAQVDATNFYDYFKGNEGGAQLFSGDLSNGEITLTPDEKNKVGGVTLKNKIGLDQSFVWKGRVGLGNKTVAEVANADGISAIFHTAEPGALGATGANMGAGGLPNALGFKFDTPKYEISDDLFQTEVQASVKEGAKNGVSVQLNPAIDYHEHIDAEVIENALIPKLAEDKLVPEKLTNLAKDYRITYINGKVKGLADIPNTRVDLVSSRVSLVSLGIASMLLGYFVVPKVTKGRKQTRK